MINPYPSEKFMNAVYSLASSPESIQTRIAFAYSFNLAQLDVDELPKSIQEEFEALTRKITSVAPTGDEGSVIASTRQMSDEEASEISKSILHMAEVVQSEFIKEMGNR